MRCTDQVPRPVTCRGAHCAIHCVLCMVLGGWARMHNAAWPAPGPLASTPEPDRGPLPSGPGPGGRKCSLTRF